MNAPAAPLESRIFNNLMALAALAHFGLVAALAFRYVIPVPVWDECEMLPAVRNVMEGRWLFSDLWAQCNEHRLVFPKFIILVLARLSSWNLTWELAAQYAFGVALFALLAREMLDALRRLDFRHAALALPAVSILLFSAKQTENWRWGWQMCFTLATLAACAALLTLAKGQLNARRAAGAVALALVGTFSHGSALLVWPVGLAAILLRRDDPVRERLKFAAAWCAAGAATVAVYRIGLRHTPDDAHWTYVFLHAPEAVWYFLVLLGSLISGRPAALAGAAGLALCAILTWRIFRRQGEEASAAFPFAMLALYSLAVMLVLTAGRLSYGMHTARVPRYGMFAVPFWLFVILELLVARRLTACPNWRRACLAGALLIMALGLKSSLSNADSFRENYEYMRPAIAQMDDPRDDELLKRIYPDVATLRMGLPELRARKLTIYRNKDE